MMEIKRFEDGTVIEQGRGNFDDYCVYLTRPGQNRDAPRDEDCFSFFINMAKEYLPEKIYSDYVRIYDKTTSEIEDKMFRDIEQISTSYDKKDRLEVSIWYSFIYLGMIAEEKKRNAVLKKRIKRLGMYQILFEGMTARTAAKFSFGKKVAELDPLCHERGF